MSAILYSTYTPSYRINVGFLLHIQWRLNLIASCLGVVCSFVVTYGHVHTTAACDESSVLMAAQEEPEQDVIAPYSAPQGGEVRQTHGCRFLCQALKAMQ